MVIVMKNGHTEVELEAVIAKVEALGYQAHVIRGTHRSVIGCVGDERGKARLQSLESMEGVESVVPICLLYTSPSPRD